MEPTTKYNIPELKAALKNEHGYYLDNRDVQHLLGKERGNHLPDQGFEMIHNGVTIKCDPKAPSTGRKSSKHRVHFFCACCKFVPLGRAGQHLPKCEANDYTI